MGFCGHADADFILDDICYPRGEMSYILYIVGILFSQRKMPSGMNSEWCFLTKYFNDTVPIRDHVVQLYPHVSQYIKNSFEGILMYEIAGGFN